ncbi:hypothetical protein HUK80_06860 [Flavobacterium sp. MAH-1]|uniref:Lipoprotein n=1 Tax=Flavobacterium agri TaxID=2743471 RepID=A0A7Y8Y2D4_9FLAO|nr:hypothetical protein [Flavobacterium agri]NUY80609.1 hypothetical protein [Flavobacterium agri]NYA70633.1 hypothetical protein [Flavobacterium agri]
MKKFLLGLAIIGSVFTGCGSDDDTSVTPPATGTITGTITTDTTYPYGNYTLVGIVKIASGVTVTFDKGSTITCNKTTGDNALVVLNGGKLVVNGTASEPVVFTEASAVPGSWGGIIMYGDAPINAIGGVASSTSEDGNALPYGGTNAAHNGGALHYVRVEYAGAKLGDGTKENNAFTFYSVGSGTVLDHLVAYKGADDGYEFFGGTVSATDLISYGNYDDAFDWQDGWKGANNSNWYGYQTVKGNFGMEIEASNNNNAFFPTISNITLKRAAGTTPEVAGAIEIDAIQFKKEGNGNFNNVVIDGYGNYTEASVTYEGVGIKIQDAATNTDQVNASKIKVTNVKLSNTTHEVKGATDAISVSFPSGNYTTSASATGASITTGNWTTVNGASLIQ